MTEEVKRVGDLDIEEDLSAQQLRWKIQRLGWAVVALILLCALLGLLGGKGPLNSRTVGDSGNPIQAQYQPFGRLDAQTPLRVAIRPRQADSPVQVWLSQSYLEAVDIERVTPEPSEQKVDEDRVTYSFRQVSRQQPATITFFVKPSRWGSLSGEVGAPGAAPLSLMQFSYP